MSKYIAYIELTGGNREYVALLDYSRKEVGSTIIVNNALLFDDNLKQTVRRYSRKSFPSSTLKIVRLEKFDNLLFPIDKKINSLYEGYNGWDVVDWKNNTEEPVLIGKEMAKSELINGIETFDDFTTFVADEIAKKHNLKKKKDD